jgi:hypothetical protein
MEPIAHGPDWKVPSATPFHKAVLATILSPRLLSGGSLLPEEKLALSLSLLLLVAAVILFA